MDFTLPSKIAVVASVFASLICIYYFLWILYMTKHIGNPKALPEAKGSWPIFGHLPLLGSSELPHVLLGNMADKHGLIFAIKLGTRKAVVVSDWKIAEDCYSSNDKVFMNRPKSIGVEIMGYNYALFGLGPSGPYWQNMRKITRELLSAHQIEMSQHSPVSEIKEFIKDIYDFWQMNTSDHNHMVKIDMKQWLGCLTMNIMLRMIVGQRYKWNEEEGIRFLKLINTFTELFGRFVVGDSVPYLRWLDWGGYEKAMRKTAKETDCILERWLQQHKQSRKLKDEQHDILDMMLSTTEGSASQHFEGFDADNVIKGTMLAYITGSADTITVTLTWTLYLLISNPPVLKKARDELNNYIGGNRQVEESDVKNLVYLQAIVKESMRLYPATQLLPSRESLKDCVIGGYNIPKGTRLIVNLSKIHRDPQVWANPNDFQPERFLTSHQNVDVKGNHYELLPFGSGRRRCPGIFLSLRVMHLALASLVHGFEFQKPSDEPDDMSATAGLNNSKAQFKVLLKPIISNEK
ncbi:cytochrome P450 CYP82D47-like [Apium graveolens]|uniref:cytochrome P450 CYP82D47-like n=1 Tax=Apium graveolens TaxID=4045 RepID=UPI003D79149D